MDIELSHLDQDPIMAIKVAIRVVIKENQWRNSTLVLLVVSSSSNRVAPILEACLSFLNQGYPTINKPCISNSKCSLSTKCLVRPWVGVEWCNLACILLECLKLCLLASTSNSINNTSSFSLHLSPVSTNLPKAWTPCPSSSSPRCKTSSAQIPSNLPPSSSVVTRSATRSTSTSSVWSARLLPPRSRGWSLICLRLSSSMRSLLLRTWKRRSKLLKTCWLIPGSRDGRRRKLRCEQKNNHSHYE